MEAKIYNPVAYKTPGVYNGAGGIYNGNGVYKGGFKSPWVLLNNCDNLEDNKCFSLVGEALYNDDLAHFGDLIDSVIFTGTKSINLTSNKVNKFRNIITEDVFTLEMYFSNIPNGSMSIPFEIYAFNSSFFMSQAVNKLCLGAYHAYDFNTVYPVENWTADYEVIVIPNIQSGHIAVVFDKTNKSKNVFVNGVKIGSFKSDIFADLIEQVSWGASGILEFFAVRNGDFSNNLESFTVPTQKYSL